MIRACAKKTGTNEKTQITCSHVLKVQNATNNSFGCVVYCAPKGEC